MSDVINSLVEAGLTIEYLHEFPYSVRAKFPFMEQGEDGWRRLPVPYHGTIPFLLSLQVRKRNKGFRALLSNNTFSRREARLKQALADNWQGFRRSSGACIKQNQASVSPIFGKLN